MRNKSALTSGLNSFSDCFYKPKSHIVKYLLKSSKNDSLNYSKEREMEDRHDTENNELFPLGYYDKNVYKKKLLKLNQRLHKGFGYLVIALVMLLLIFCAFQFYYKLKKEINIVSTIPFSQHHEALMEINNQNNVKKHSGLRYDNKTFDFNNNKLYENEINHNKHSEIHFEDADDDWMGDDASELNVTSIHSKTHEFRLPFIDGQSNETHIIGTFNDELKFPKSLEISGRVGGNSDINGIYHVMMADELRSKPMLFHGRLIWQKINNDGSKHFLYFDHTNQNWVISNVLQFETPNPIAFLHHGTLFPYSKNKDIKDNRLGVPKGVYWVVRNANNKKPEIDKRLKVEASKIKYNCEVNGQCIKAKLVRIYHAPDEYNDHEDQMKDDDYEDENSWVDETSDKHITPNGEIIPPEAKTLQMFITHAFSNVYHTFDIFHKIFDHEKIVEDPLNFISLNSHPFVERPEENIFSVDSEDDENIDFFQKEPKQKKRDVFSHFDSNFY